MLIASVILYRQSHERLARLVASLGNGKVDAAVFLDGPYLGLSDVVSSGNDCYRFIADECEKVGIQYAIFGGEVYDGEPAKRTAAAQSARLYPWEPLPQRRNEALGQERWLLIIDSDEWIESDVIDWSLIEAHGTGTISLDNWQDGAWCPDTPGNAAKMVRIIPLLPGLVWGPAHYDVMDIHTGITLLGHEKGLSTPHPPCALLGHDVGRKTIAEAYELYNDSQRVEAEGKTLRIAEVAKDGSFVIVRMDRDQAQGEWSLGMIAGFPEHMLPHGLPEMQAVLVSVTDAESSPLLVDLLFERRTDDEVGALIAERQQLAQIQAHRDQMLLERRRLKANRKQAKRARIAQSQRRRGA